MPVGTRLFLPVLLASWLAASCASVGTVATTPAVAQPARASAGCGAAAPTAAGSSLRRTIRVGQLEREYRLHLPASYDPGVAMPLVLVIHGYTGTAEKTENEETSFSRHGDRHGYVVAYPQATGFDANGSRITSWNDRGCNASPGPEGSICTDRAVDYPTPPECGAPRECDWCSCHDDVAFIAAMLDELEGTLCLDLDRIYATGISNGGMFVHRLGCDLPSRFAAIAPVAGTIAKGFGCAPAGSPKISMINVHGRRDRVVPFDGSSSDDGFLYTPASQVLAAWAGVDSQRCAGEVSPYKTSKDGILDFRCVQRAGCESGAEVVDCGWDGGHDWPRTSGDEFGIDVIWEFFAKNGR